MVRGQLDLTAVGAFREGLTRATRANRAVEIHLGDVDFIDGCGLSMLIDTMSRAHDADCEIRIVEVSSCVRSLIEITDTAARLAPLPAADAVAFPNAAVSPGASSPNAVSPSAVSPNAAKRLRARDARTSNDPPVGAPAQGR
jgi:anti-anti-sigma factor